MVHEPLILLPFRIVSIEKNEHIHTIHYTLNISSVDSYVLLLIVLLQCKRRSVIDDLDPSGGGGPRNHNVPGHVDAPYPSDHFIDLVPQHAWRHDRLLPDWLLPRFAIETALTVDIDVEFESRSSPDLSACDRLE